MALGTSETAGWGVLADEPYSPQAAYPALYARILCQELGVPVELHSYFPSQLGNELAPLSWWIGKVNGDEQLRADLATADVVALWSLSAHDIVPLQLFGGCSGSWPDPLKACLAEGTADIAAEMGELFRLISELVPDRTTVLAGDGFTPPPVVRLYADKPYRDDVKALLDPLYAAQPAALDHGFIFVDTEVAFNGPSRWEMPSGNHFQADGWHMTSAGQQLAAETYAAADGLGD